MVDSTITFEAAYKEIATLKLNYGDGPEEQQVQLIVVKPGSKVTVEPVFSWDNPFTDVSEDE